jgi:hypothetical protein
VAATARITARAATHGRFHADDAAAAATTTTRARRARGMRLLANCRYFFDIKPYNDQKPQQYMSLTAKFTEIVAQMR